MAPRTIGLVAALAVAITTAFTLAVRERPARVPEDLVLQIQVKEKAPGVDAWIRSHQSSFRTRVPRLDGWPGPLRVPSDELLELDLQHPAARFRLTIPPAHGPISFPLDHALPNEIVLRSRHGPARPAAALLRFDWMAESVSSAIPRVFTLDRYPFRIPRMPDARGTVCVLHDNRPIERHVFDVGPARRSQDISLTGATTDGPRLTIRSTLSGGDAAPLAGFRIVDGDGQERFAGFTDHHGVWTIGDLPPETPLFVRPREDVPNCAFASMPVGVIGRGQAADLTLLVTRLPRFQVSFGPGWDPDLPVTVAVSDETTSLTDGPFSLRELERPVSLRLAFPPGAKAVRVEAVQAGTAAVARARVERRSVGAGRRVQLMPPVASQVELQVLLGGESTAHRWVACDVEVEGLTVRGWRPLTRVGRTLVVPLAPGDRRVVVRARPPYANANGDRTADTLASLELRPDGPRRLVLALGD